MKHLASFRAAPIRGLNRPSNFNGIGSTWNNNSDAWSRAQKKDREFLPSPCFEWSERLDSNQRPLSPQNSALPGCATLRHGGRL